MNDSTPSNEVKPHFQYWAFISYSSKDRAWAQWLHHALETYRLPVQLLKHPTPMGEHAPRRFKPLFWDRAELQAHHDLGELIERSLRVSRYLIVICSPHAAQSPWVEKEIQTFQQMHGRERVLSIIVAGEPGAKDDTNCFPPTLRAHEPKAPDARKQGDGKTNAKLMLLATMLGVNFDALKRREQERRMKMLMATLAGTMMVLACMGWLAWRESVARKAETIAKQAAEAQTRRAIESEMIAKQQKKTAEAQTLRATNAEKATQAQLVESNRQLERSQVEEGRAWLERGRAALNKGDHLSALMLAGRAVGYQGYGRGPQEALPFSDAFPLLLANPMRDPTAEKERAAEALGVTQFLDSVRPTHLPLWTGAMKSDIDSVAFSPDGTRLASGSGDKTIKLWDTATGKQLANLEGHEVSVTSVAFSPDGTRLASYSFDEIKLWDAATGKQLVTIEGHTDSLVSFAFSPDGTRLASGSLDMIKLWDSAKGKELASIKGPKGYVHSVAFSPDGTRLASCSEDDKTIKLWDPATGKQLANLQGHTDSVSSVSFSPDGTRLASISLDNTIKLWDTATGKELASIKGPKGHVVCVAFSPDGTRLASGAENDNTIKLWDTATGKQLASLQGHTRFVWSVAFSPDGTRLASGGSDNMIKLWDTAPGRQLASLQGHTNSVSCVAFSPDGTCLASVDRVLFSPDSTRVPRHGHHSTIKLWDTATGKELSNLQYTDQIIDISFSPDGTRLASCSDDSTIKLWDTATGKQLVNIQHTDRDSKIAFSPDGTRLASYSGDSTIMLWDTVTGKELANLQGHTQEVLSVTFSPDGARLASGGHDRTIKIWDTATGKELASLHGHKDYVSSVVFSPDGRRLASNSENDKTIMLWDTALGKELTSAMPEELAAAKRWLAARDRSLHPDQHRMAEIGIPGTDYKTIFIAPNPPQLDLTAPLRASLLALSGRELQFPEVKQTTPMLHVRQDTLAQLADPKLTPERYAELRMELCTKSSQFRAATALWQRLLQVEWPGFEGATVTKDQAPETIPADSPIRRLYLLALIDATKHPLIHGHPTICQTAAQIVPVLTREMIVMPTVSLAMMSLMQALAKDESAEMGGPRAALMKRLEEVAAKEWLAVLRESTAAGK